MRPDVLIRLRTNPNLALYLKYHSEWYKELIRNPDSINIMESYMKKEFKLTLEDKLARTNEKLNMIKTFLDVLK